MKTHERDFSFKNTAFLWNIVKSWMQCSETFVKLQLCFAKSLKGKSSEKFAKTHQVDINGELRTWNGKYYNNVGYLGCTLWLP